MKFLLLVLSFVAGNAFADPKAPVCTGASVDPDLYGNYRMTHMARGSHITNFELTNDRAYVRHAGQIFVSRAFTCERDGEIFLVFGPNNQRYYNQWVELNGDFLSARVVRESDFPVTTEKVKQWRRELTSKWIYKKD